MNYKTKLAQFNRLKTFNKIFILLFLIGIVLLVSPAYAAKKNVTIGYFPWAENVAVTHVWKKILESHNYNVKLVNGTLPVIYQGVGQGSINFTLEIWLPYAAKDFYDAVKNNVNLIGPWYAKAWQGLAVPDYVDIDSISQLANNAKAFQEKGQAFIYCASPGTVVSHHAKDAIKMYNLPFKAMCSSEAAALAQAQRDITKKKPVVFTIWNPHWAWHRYNIKMLKDPKGAFAKPNHLYIVAHKGFGRTFPKIKKMLKQFHMTSKQLSRLMDTVHKAKNPESGASTWMKHNKNIWHKWIAAK